MIILDTNIISEIMKKSPSLHVMQWFDQQVPHNLFITISTIAEVNYGLQVLASGKKRNHLQAAFDQSIQQAFAYRVLSFDEDSAIFYGKLMAHRKKLGRPLSVCDGQIAAIACTHGFAVATRNMKDFYDCNIELINPFS